MKQEPIDRELVSLFGREIVALSKELTVDELIAEAELVAEGARQLRACTNQPMKQRQIVNAMATETAAALCRWIKGIH